jgi:predicted adenine nucleotide alpha hydrolase (AANH) superfamily ATPase
MKLLMHTCCAPCSVYCIDSLREEGIEPTLYWFNPNIHPYMEYKARRDTLKEYAQSINVEAIFEENYGLEEFCKNVIEDLNNRCQNYCYRVRLEKTAKYAKENEYDAITTTLLVSPYQKHEILKKQAEEIAKKYGLNFLYRDFRVGFREGQAKARELGLYMQKYCGCIFSEEMSKSAHQKKDKEESARANRDTERRIRLSDTIPNLDFRPLKRENKEEINFIYNIKKEKYKEENKKELDKEILNKLLERYIKENAKNIKVIMLKEEKIGFFDGKILENNTFRIDNIFLLKEYQNKGIDKVIFNEVFFENKQIMEKKN